MARCEYAIRGEALQRNDRVHGPIRGPWDYCAAAIQLEGLQKHENLHSFLRYKVDGSNHDRPCLKCVSPANSCPLRAAMRAGGENMKNQRHPNYLQLRVNATVAGYKLHGSDRVRLNKVWVAFTKHNGAKWPKRF